MIVDSSLWFGWLRRALLLALLGAAASAASAEIGGSIDEPSGRVKLPVNPELSCPGFYVVRTHPGQSSAAGRIGTELLLSGSGLRTLQGGLNFGGWATPEVRGFAAFSIANASGEAQRVDIALDAEAAGRLVLERRSGGHSTVLIDQPVAAGRIDLSRVVTAGFYVIAYRPDTAGASQFSIAALSSFTDRPGGGFQGGAVFGGYHDPGRSITSFGGFCIAQEFEVGIEVLSSSYGSSGAAGLEFSVIRNGLSYLDSRAPAFASPALNDSGIGWCADGSTRFLDCPLASHPGQDGDHGRDAQARAGTLVKLGAGAAGFDYTKLDANGQALPDTADQWSCVRDNHTGLIWEVKVDDPAQLRYRDRQYLWSDAPGAPGMTSRGFVEAVNAEGLCGANDWRLPEFLELHSLVHYGRQLPAIDTDYFPNTAVRGSAFDLGYLTARRAAGLPEPWFIDFGDGSTGFNSLGFGPRGWIRLVRGGPSQGAATERQDSQRLQRTASSSRHALSGRPTTESLQDEPGLSLTPDMSLDEALTDGSPGLPQDGCLLSTLPRSTPSADFSLIEDGSLLEQASTGLVWQRCPWGQSWDGSRCTGTAARLSWQQALQAAEASGPQWRLPSIRELQGIVERCTAFPAINRVAFPWPIEGSGVAGFWSGSPGAGQAGQAWSLNFATGEIVAGSQQDERYLRLVRSGAD